MAFGDAFASKELSVNIRGQNDAGETWDEVQDGRFRVTHDTVQSPFNSMLTSNAFQSQNSVKSYMFDIGGNAFSANISGRNISTTQDSATLKGTRFSDMNLEEHRARNFYGVIADTDAQAGRFSNVGYSGNLMGINFAVRSNFQPGLDIEKISGTQNNVLERASVHYNPYTALTSNQFDAQSFAMNTNISNFIKLGMATTVGKSNFGNTNIYQGIIAVDNSTNLSQTLSISHHKNGNLVGVDFGFLRETLTLLGTYSSGAFALGENNTTAFMKANVSQKLFGKTSLIGSVSVGRTSANELQNSLFSNITPLVSRSFVVGLKTEFLKGNFEFTYSHPLAIISGRAFFDGANGKQTIFLTPSAQEQDFAISYAVNSKNSRLSLNGAYILNQNNLNVKPTLGFFVSVGRGW